MRSIVLAGLVGAALFGSPGWAQDAKPGCTPATTASATPPAKGADSGTAPGGMGSNAWSGGTGGSYIGTVPQGSTSSTGAPQPATSTGLDPTKPGGPAPSC